MVKSYEDLVGVIGREQKSRRKRFPAFTLFGGETPALFFDDQRYELLDISGSGFGAAAAERSEFEDLEDQNRMGVLRLVQNGRELFLGAARRARVGRRAGKIISGFALEQTHIDLIELQQRNVAALAQSSHEIPTAKLRASDNGFLRSDRAVDKWLGDYPLLLSEIERVASRFEKGDIIAAMADGRDVLLKARADFGPVRWREAVDEIRNHELASYILRCPVTRRSFRRPRGYPGDAPLLDLIYGTGDVGPWPHPSSIAGQVSFFVVHSSACRAVRQRREILARQIDKISEERSGAAILSIACGHLRELALSERAGAGGIGKFIAVDQDAESLREVRESIPDVDIDLVEGSVRAIISNKLHFRDIDFAYAAGLLDYLVSPVAMRLIERMFSFLRPGGKLLVANFTPAGEDIGYMEAFMDWWLIYRTKDEIAELFVNLPRDQVKSIEIFEDDRGVIAYAIVEKTAP